MYIYFCSLTVGLNRLSKSLTDNDIGKSLPKKSTVYIKRGVRKSGFPKTFQTDVHIDL